MGKHRNKKNRVEKKTAASPKNPEIVRGHQEHDEEKVINKSEPVQGQQEPKNDKSLLSCESMVDWAEGNNSDTEQWIQIYTEATGLDDEQKKTEANGIGRAVEARRKDSGREPTAAQEQGKEVSYTEEEKEAQEAREWQERFIENRRRAQEARVEEWREQEKRRSENDENE